MDDILHLDTSTIILEYNCGSPSVIKVLKCD